MAVAVTVAEPSPVPVPVHVAFQLTATPFDANLVFNFTFANDPLSCSRSHSLPSRSAISLCSFNANVLWPQGHSAFGLQALRFFSPFFDVFMYLQQHINHIAV